MKKEQGKTFNYDLDFGKTDFRQHPELYRVGKGEQGVLLVEPYKSEILPHWRFRTPEIATESSETIYAKFRDYLQQNDFVGADMARKFLQMGYTRARRYANHKSGRKYEQNPQQEPTWEQEKAARKKYLLPNEPDAEKAQSAQIFKEKWELAKADETYQRMLLNFKQMNGAGK
ncbi:DUF4385 domain-containing protein [Pontibacter liquoris]|uniref:DUF4385 domain-containing protein n=1 Tax=Pontibacter liquoris TaxID=2905677 RepID=UPI001FA81207|nr:DUF4385 domain-containing protein [Pontibacter liquoris]